MQDATTDDDDKAGEAPAEVDLSHWLDIAEAAATARFTVMARRLPALIREALRLAWRTGRAETVATVALNLLSGVFTAFGLLATTGVLEALLAAGTTPGRVRAALPALLLVAGAGMARPGCRSPSPARPSWRSARAAAPCRS